MTSFAASAPSTLGDTQPPPRNTRAREQALRIVQSFNTWSFKREQPDSAEKLTATIAHAVQAQRPVEFVMYWGKGPRNFIADPEEKTLDYLNSMMARIRASYAPGTRVTLILTDTHARLNGHSVEAMTAYFDGVRALARERNFHTELLSDIVERAGGSVAEPSVPDAALLESLIRSAQKWHFGGLSAKAAAEAYFAQNMIERAAVGAVHSEAIFLSYNGAEQRPLFPENLAVFYMYALKRGVAVKPWFMQVA